MPTQMPHLTQSPEAASAERMEATALMLPPGPHQPLTPPMPLPASPTSSSQSSAPLFKEDKYSSTSEEESEADGVTFIHGRSNGTFANHQAERPMSTPMTSDYTTQGNPDASPSNLFRSSVISDEFLGTNNFFKVMDHQVTITTATQNMDTTNPTNRRNQLMYLSRYMDQSAKSNYIRSRRYYNIRHSTGTGSNQKTTR